MILNSNTPRLWIAAANTWQVRGHGQADTLEMDVTFVGSRQMEVRDAVKLSSWPTPRKLSLKSRS